MGSLKSLQEVHIQICHYGLKIKKACINIQNDDNKCFMYAVQCGVYEIHKKPHPETKSHYENDKSKNEIPAVQQVNFEHCNFLMEIDDDESNEIEEFEKDSGNRISINLYGIHRDIKKSCEDRLVGEYE